LQNRKGEERTNGLKGREKNAHQKTLKNLSYLAEPTYGAEGLYKVGRKPAISKKNPLRKIYICTFPRNKDIQVVLFLAGRMV